MKSRNKIRLGNGNMYHIVPHIQQSSMRKKPGPSILSLHPSSICVKPGCCSSTRGPELSTSFNTLKEDQSALSRKPAQIWGWHYPSLSLPDATCTVYVLYARIVLKQWHVILYITFYILLYCTHWICVDIHMCTHMHVDKASKTQIIIRICGNSNWESSNSSCPFAWEHP